MRIKRQASEQRVEKKESLRAFEIPPVNLDLLRAEEREAAIAATRELYDAIPGPFQILSVPIERSPSEHLDWLTTVPGAPRRFLTAYTGLYRDLAAHLARPPRRCLLVLSAASETAAARVAELVRRTGEEHGIRLRAISQEELARATSLLSGAGAEYRVGPNVVEGPETLTLVALGRRWPAQIEPGWTAPVLALTGVDAISMRVRPLSRAEAMSFLTVRLRQVRAAERLASERGELSDVERERVLQTSASGRRTVHAGAGRLYLVDPIILVHAADPAALAERLDVLRLEMRSLGFEPEVATFRLADGWRGVVPGRIRRPSRSGTSTARALPRACSTSRATCTSPRVTCTAGSERPERLSCWTASPVPRTTPSFWARPALARQWRRGRKSSAASCRAYESWRWTRWVITDASQLNSAACT